MTSLVLLSLYLASLAEAKLLPYMNACKRNDPKLAECVAKGSIVPVPHFVDGDSKLGIPVLDPLDIQEMTISQGTDQVGLTLVVKNAVLHGNKNNKIVGSRPDLVKRRIEWDFVNDKGYELEGDYMASGKVLILPITGQGKIYLKFSKVKSVLGIDYELIKRGGKEYMNVTHVTARSTIDDAYFKLDNLFNGDKLLGDNMNQVLNDNAKEMATSLEPSLGLALAQLYHKILNERLLPSTTYDEIFPK